MTNDDHAQGTYLGHYAGFATRFVAFVIDLVLVTIIVSLTLAVGRFILDSLESLFLLRLSDLTSSIAVVIIVLVAISFYLLYYLGFWTLLGQTPGKWIMGVRIVGTDGGRVGLVRAVLRLFGYYLSMILFIGYLWILVDKRRQGLHDKVAATLVVYSWPEPNVVHPPRDRRTRRGRPNEEGQDKGSVS